MVTLPSRPAAAASASAGAGAAAAAAGGAAGFFSFFSPAEQRFTAAASVLSTAVFIGAVGLVQRLSRVEPVLDEGAASGEGTKQPPPQAAASKAAPRPMTPTPTPAPTLPGPSHLVSPGGRGAGARLSTPSPPPPAAAAQPAATKGEGKASSSSSGSSSNSIRLDREFIQRLARLLRVLIPSWRTREAGWLGAMATLLLARTACDLRMISLIVGAERAIVMGDRAGFRASLARFLRFMVPVSCVNALLKYATRELSLGLRQRLTAHLHAKYLCGFTFYTVAALEGRAREVEQLMTVDVDKFCSSLTELASNILKPSLDIIIYARRLQTSVGGLVPFLMALYLFSSGAVLTRARRPTGEYTALIQRREGEYRYVAQRLVTHAEEVAFYDGIRRERSIIRRTFDRLLGTIRRATQFRYSMDVLDSVLAKYLATALGWLLLARVAKNPMFGLGKAPPPKPAATSPSSSSSSYEDFHRSARMMFNLAQALGALVLAGREATRLAGYTARVSRLEQTLDELRAQEEASEGMVEREKKDGGEQQQPPRQQQEQLPLLLAGGGGSGGDKGEEDEGEGERKRGRRRQGKGKEVAGCRVLERDGVIEFKDVPIVTPSPDPAHPGKQLVSPLSFRVTAGLNVLVTGPNGSGKSSLFRMLCGLWPVTQGTLTKPARGQLFYIPQRPYLPLGSLRDQVIYPHARADMAAAGRTDADVLALLREVQLEYLAGVDDALADDSGEEGQEDAEAEGSGMRKAASSSASLFALPSFYHQHQQQPTQARGGKRGQAGAKAREGLDRVCDWGETLSGGEKQRIAMARLFYHRPQFAILDECTSAVSSDVEDRLYARCRELGITLLTVAHRRTLWRHHDCLLLLDGKGGWSFRSMADVEPEAALSL